MTERLTFAQLRARAGESQNQLARALEVALGTVQGIEKGRQLPHVDLALKIARHFGVHVEDIEWLMPEPGRRGKERAA